MKKPNTLNLLLHPKDSFMDNLPESSKNLPIYQPGKSIDEIKRIYQLKKVIKLASNENPLGPSPQVKKALSHYAEDISRYPDDAAPDLKKALSQYLEVNEGQLILGAGSCELLEMIARRFLTSDNNLILSQYSFSMYRIFGKVTGANCKFVKDNDFQQDTAGILAAIDQDTRLIFLANPNNPTGTWIKSNELFSFIRQVPQNIIVVIDEAYAEYMDDDEYSSALKLINECPNLIICRTFSKAFALADIRLGVGIASPLIIKLLEGLKKPFNVSNMALTAGLAALKDKQHLKETLATNRIAIKKLSVFFKKHQLKVLAHSCNFLTVDFGEKAQSTAQSLLEKGIIVRTLEAYQMPNYIRVSTGTPEEIDFFITEIEKILSTQ